MSSVEADETRETACSSWNSDRPTALLPPPVDARIESAPHESASRSIASSCLEFGELPSMPSISRNRS
jgi:hypothetical protein